jgi:hypothetical protein
MVLEDGVKGEKGSQRPLGVKAHQTETLTETDPSRHKSDVNRESR